MFYLEPFEKRTDSIGRLHLHPTPGPVVFSQEQIVLITDEALLGWGVACRIVSANNLVRAVSLAAGKNDECHN